MRIHNGFSLLQISPLQTWEFLKHGNFWNFPSFPLQTKIHCISKQGIERMTVFVGENPSGKDSIGMLAEMSKNDIVGAQNSIHGGEEVNLFGRNMVSKT